MAKIIRNNPIHHAIESIEIEQKQRDYIGYSSIGAKCTRKLWYDYRHTYKKMIPLRIKRLLDRGEAEEKIIIEDLKRVGMFVFNRQMEVVNKKYPKLRGHIDGCVNHIPDHNLNKVMLLEMKTANHARFEKLKKQGLQDFSNVYWMQIQGYMHELGLKDCLHVVTNKNNDERIYQIYSYNSLYIKDIPYIVEDILDSNTIPIKIGNPIWWECKSCDAYNICQNQGDITENCRNCEHGTITVNGVVCNLEGYSVTKCSKYKKLQVL